MGLMQESRLSVCTHQSLQMYLRLRLGENAKTSSRAPESPPTARSHQDISERAKSTDSELLSARSRGLNTLKNTSMVFEPVLGDTASRHVFHL